MRIPSSFEQFGVTVLVKQVDGKAIPGSNGVWDDEKGLIRIEKGLTKERKLHVFLHEFFHCALDTAGYSRLSSDEVLVDALAGLTAQMLKTAR